MVLINMQGIDFINIWIKASDMIVAHYTYGFNVMATR